MWRDRKMDRCVNARVLMCTYRKVGGLSPIDLPREMRGDATCTKQGPNGNVILKTFKEQESTSENEKD